MTENLINALESSESLSYETKHDCDWKVSRVTRKPSSDYPRQLVIAVNPSAWSHKSHLNRGSTARWSRRGSCESRSPMWIHRSANRWFGNDIGLGKRRCSRINRKKCLEKADPWNEVRSNDSVLFSRESLGRSDRNIEAIYMRLEHNGEYPVQNSENEERGWMNFRSMNG